MILDAGMCTVYGATNGAPAGNKPLDVLTVRHRSWFGELNFETAPAYPTLNREEVEASTRVRVFQHRGISNRDAATLDTQPGIRYEVTRVYHGRDDDSGELISDLTLRRVW